LSHHHDERPIALGNSMDSIPSKAKHNAMTTTPNQSQAAKPTTTVAPQ
jgi:hypothetical protein